MKDTAVAIVAIVALFLLSTRREVSGPVSSADSVSADTGPLYRPVNILDTPHAGLIDQMADPINATAGPWPAAIPYNGQNAIAGPRRKPVKTPTESKVATMPGLIKPSAPSAFDPDYWDRVYLRGSYTPPGGDPNAKNNFKFKDSSAETTKFLDMMRSRGPRPLSSA